MFSVAYARGFRSKYACMQWQLQVPHFVQSHPYLTLEKPYAHNPVQVRWEEAKKARSDALPHFGYARRLALALLDDGLAVPDFHGRPLSVLWSSTLRGWGCSRDCLSSFVHVSDKGELYGGS